MAKGKKTCPKCNTILGCRTKVCGCGYDFFKTRPINLIKEQVEKEKNYVPQLVRQHAEALYTLQISYHGLKATERILKAALQLVKQEKERRSLIE